MNEASPATPVPLLLNKSRLIEQISHGPTLHAAAWRQLHTALRQRFPDLDIDPDKAVVMSPIWHERNGALVSDSCDFESLCHVMARLAFEQEYANYVEGEHFLTLTPHAQEPVHLPVDMDALTLLLNEQAAQMFVHFQQTQLDYWNETVDGVARWHALSDTARSALDIQSINGWDADQCALCRLVSKFPDKASRPLKGSGFSNVRACMLDLDYAFEFADSIDTRHLMSPGALVLTANLGDRELIVMYTITDGYEAFDSMEHLGTVLPDRIDIDLGSSSLKWRLYEPEGNVFDAMVWSLVNCQLDSIDALDPASRSEMTQFAPRRNEIRTLSARDNTHIAQLADAIPAWLSAGSLEDIHAYSGSLQALGRLRELADDDAFVVEDFPSIQVYAQQQMRNAIAAERKGEAAEAWHLDDVRITITQSFEADSLTLPSPVERSIETLGQFALRNTRPYLAAIAYTDGSATPDWMTIDLLVRLADQVNIGEVYPQLVKRALIDDPVQSLRHKARYCRQLPYLLQLRALECKLRQEGDVDERGYSQICRLMTSIANDTPTAGWTVQIRPLAFMPHYRLSNEPDVVANMYIIGPRNGRHAPCLLYRPLMERTLLQFESEQNMLYAFHQPGELRDSILAWLADDDLSFEYSQYVFPCGVPSPRAIAELAFEPFIHLGLSPSIRLAGTPLSGDIPATLFASHSLTLARLAERQSTSNAERRRALLVDSGWALFGVATNFLSGPAGAALWVWQGISQIQAALAAHGRGDTVVQWSSIGDVLLTLSIILTHRMAWRRLRLVGSSQKIRPVEPSPQPTVPVSEPASASPARIVQGPALQSAELPVSHLRALAPTNGVRASSEARFRQLIDRLQVKPPTLPAESTPNERHVYETAGKSFVQVGARWFEVRDDDGQVLVIDPNDHEWPGLCIKFDQPQNRWVWDLRLRLRGGQPTGRIQALRQEKARKRDEALAALQAFKGRESDLQAELKHILNPELEEDSRAPFSAASIDMYLTQSDTLIEGYSQALRDLEIWRQEGGGGEFYQGQLMRLSIAQHRCINGWIRLKIREYISHVKPLMSQSPASDPVARAQQREASRIAIAISQNIVDKLDLMDSTIVSLDKGSGQTREVARRLERLRPVLSRYDFLANEIGMSMELCLRELPGSDVDATRQIIFHVFDNAGAAGHALVEHPAASEPVVTDAQKTERLTALVDRLEDCLRRLEELRSTHPDQLETLRFKRTEDLVTELHQLARRQLLERLPEPQEAPVAAMARLDAGPSTSRAAGKVSKQRPRTLETTRTPAEPRPVYEVPIIKAPARNARQPVSENDDEILDRGRSLYGKVNLFIKHTRADSRRPRRIPADMKDLFDQQAARLEAAAEEVHAVYERDKASGNARRADNFLSQDLRAAAEKCRREGIRAYSDIIKKRKPREIYLRWLHEQGQIDIVTDTRGRIQTRQRKDYFQEYRVLDRQNGNKPLWVAHFHYDKPTDPDSRFTAAHLKCADEYLQSLPEMTRRDLSDFDPVDNALRRLTDPAMLELFLRPRPITR